MAFDAIKNQPMIREHVGILPAFWEKSNHFIDRMWQVYYSDGKSEVIIIPVNNKDLEVGFITAFCKQSGRKPIALMLIAEAWAFEASPQLAAITDFKLLSDPEYYAAYRAKCRKIERFMAHVETSLGNTIFSWDIIRDDLDGKPRLGELMEIYAPKEESIGRFDNIISPFDAIRQN